MIFEKGSILSNHYSIRNYDEMQMTHAKIQENSRMVSFGEVSLIEKK